MLVLTRKVGEAILLADGLITIRVLKTSNGSTQIGIEAPRDITILREELVQKKEPANVAG